MKKSNRLSVKIVAFLMTCLMVFSCVSTVFAAQADVVETDYYKISYNSDSDVPEVVLTLDSAAFGKLLAERNFTKEELKEFLPEIFVKVFETKTMPSIGEMVDFFPDSLFTLDELKRIIPEELLKKYIDEDLIKTIVPESEWANFLPIQDKVINNPNFSVESVINAADKAAFKAAVKDILTKVFLNELDKAQVYAHVDGQDVATTIFEYKNNYVWYLNDFAGAVLRSVPTVETFKNLKDGDTVYMIGLGMNFAGDPDTYGFKIAIKVEGSTAKINTYAERLSHVLNYSFANDTITVKVDDTDPESPVSFAEVLSKALSTSHLTDAEKAKLFTLFTKEGTDLIDALEALDFNVSWVDAKYVPYLTEARDKAVLALERVIDKVPGEYSTTSLADLYDLETLAFVLNKNVTVGTSRAVEKLCAVLGITKAQFDNLFGSYDQALSADIDLTFKMDDVYRVRYFDVDGNLLYTTFLPVGAELAVINDNTSVLIGQAGENGWVDVNGDVVTVMPDECIDLYPIDGSVVVPDAFYATFVADGQVVARILFHEGDTKLSRVPQVPDKIGYHGRWENYKLANKDITIKAIYTEKTYTVIFNANGGEGTMANQILTYDKAAALRACTFTREGYTFLGWNTAADGTGVFYADQQVVKNMTIVDGVNLYAQWQVVAPTVHTVTFMANGAVVDKVTFNEGDTELSRIPEVPARVGYVGAWEEFALTNEDIVVNAEYTANEYTVVFNANGGAGAIMPNQTMTYDTFAKLSANTYTYAGYKFAGWNTKADGTGASYADCENVKNLAESGEVTLYAQWDVEVTTSETTTAPVEDEGGFNWLILVIIIAVLAVVGGVVGFLVYNKKKSV